MQRYTPLLYASARGLLDISLLLWQLVRPKGRSRPDEKNLWQALTCLEVAVESGHIYLVSAFLNVWDGWSPRETTLGLTTAVRKWYKDVITLLFTRVSFDSESL